MNEQVNEAPAQAPLNGAKVVLTRPVEVPAEGAQSDKPNGAPVKA